MNKPYNFIFFADLFGRQTSKTYKKELQDIRRNDLKYKNYLIYQHFKRHKLNMEDHIKVTPIEQAQQGKLVEPEKSLLKH